MTEFISDERRQLVAAFDRHVYETDAALRHPQVATKLGELGLWLIEMNQDSFLPDTRSGGFVLPEAQRNYANTAILPLDDENATQFESLLLPLIKGAHYAWSKPAETYSPVYGVETTDALASKYANHVSNARGPVKGGALARTVTVLNYSSRETDILSSRPIMLVRRDQWRSDSEVGSTGGHELVHAIDIIHEAPLYPNILFAGASELHGYYVSATIDRATGNNPDGNSIWIDDLRQREIGNSPYPFAPNEVLMDAMIKRKLV